MLPWPTESSAERFTQVRDTSLAKLVRDDMLGLILNGTLAAGQRINEPDVAARLGVSRVPVREALRELESSGLVVARKHAGVFVRQLEGAEVRDLYQLRGLLDGFAGQQVAQRPAADNVDLLAVLDAATQAMTEAADAQDVQRYYGENLRFHWAIVEAAGNRAVTETYRGIVQKLHLSRLKNLAQHVGMQASITEHLAIVQAVRQRDPVRCHALLTAHVNRAHGDLTASPAAAVSKPAKPTKPLSTNRKSAAPRSA